MLNSSSCRKGSIGYCRQPAVHHQDLALSSRRLRSSCQAAEARRARSSAAAAAVSRRIVLSGTANAALWCPQLPAWALRTIELRDGTQVEVYEHGMTLSIVALRGSVPEQWVAEFRRCLAKYAGFELGQRGQIQDIFDELGNPGAKRSAGVADVATLGDAWLGPAIRRRLVQPIPSAETYRWWRQLPKRWQDLVQRDGNTGEPNEHGQIWGCPYRWGAMLVAYKRDQLSRHNRAPIASWSDLLQPSLKGRITFPDNPREFVGIALKTLNHPEIGFNATESDLAAAGYDRDTLRQRVQQLRSQARLFSSKDHVPALVAGDVWVVVGCSTDLVPLAERTPSVHLVAPRDGTNLWADIWVVPANAERGHLNSGPSPVLPSWLEFCVSPARAEVLNGLRSGASPVLLHDLPALQSQYSTPARNHSSRTHHKSSHKKQHHQPVDKQQQDLLEQQQQREQHALQQQQLYAATASLTATDLRLVQEGQYMPSEGVLQLSEFMLPVSSQTLDFYRWLLS